MEAHRCLLDLSCGCLAGAENEAGNLDRGACINLVNKCSRNVERKTFGTKYLQLCGLVGNFSLEMSWRDIFALLFDVSRG